MYELHTENVCIIVLLFRLQIATAKKTNEATPRIQGQYCTKYRIVFHRGACSPLCTSL